MSRTGPRLARQPRGRYATALAELLMRCPSLHTASALVDFGNHLQVQMRWVEEPFPDERMYALRRAAEAMGRRPRSMMDADAPRKVTHWFVAELAGVTVIVSAVLCECHDGLHHTLGSFEDASQVVAAVVGRVLREMTPAAYHRALAAAETVLDTEMALRRSTD